MYDVIVIGAGYAGLSAALSLREKGWNVQVLEAAERVGGRSYTEIGPNGVPVDRGAQWISSHHSRTLQLVERYGLRLVENEKPGKTVYRLAGRRKEVRSSLPPLPPLALLDAYLLQLRIERLLKRLPADRPWNTAVGRELDAQTMEQWLRRHLRTRAGYAYFKLVVESSCCLPLDQYSALEVMWNLRTAGSLKRLMAAEELWLAEGTQELANRMAEELGDSVTLGALVDAIAWSEDHGAGAEVRAGERSWRGRLVIVSIPPILTERITFDPPLPTLRAKCARHLRPGHVIKCRVTYSRPFWRDAGLSGTAYSDSGPVEYVADTTSPFETGGSLTALISGLEALRLADDSQRRRREVLDALVELFGDSAASPDHYTDTNWMEMPFALGGFAGLAAPRILSVCGDSLFEPAGPIHWAGTETATEWRSYLEGALQSGERAAKEAHRRLSKKLNTL